MTVKISGSLKFTVSFEYVLKKKIDGAIQGLFPDIVMMVGKRNELHIRFVISGETLYLNHFECHYCSNDFKNTFYYMTSLPSSSNFIPLTSNEYDKMCYFHLLNHTYEEIGECSRLLMDSNHTKSYRLFETKSIVHSILIDLIETLFTNSLHSDTFLSELLEQYSRFLHIFYGHFIPFILNNLNCLFDMTISKCLNSSFDILATIFQIACSSQSKEENCSLCIESANNNNNNKHNRSINAVS